jgi:ASC-1-like (ASCH) protein
MFVLINNSSEVWDNCVQVNSDRLEKLQLEAARIVTGLTCYTSLDSIYRETGREKLSTQNWSNECKINIFQIFPL